MTIFQTGQRWLSESELELGLGTVVAAGVQTVLLAGAFRLTEVRGGVVSEIVDATDHPSR